MCQSIKQGKGVYQLYNITEKADCQAVSDKQLQKIAERMAIKEKLTPYIAKIYRNEYDKNFLIKSRNQNLIEAFTNCGKEIFKNDNQIIGAKFCHQRICPVCNLRKSNITFHKIKDIVEALQDKEFVLITLTVKNCPANWLENTINDLMFSFHRMVNRKTWKNAFKGYFRTLEITYNSKENTFHPHLHILANLSQAYYQDYYLDNQDIRRMWTESANLNYYVQTDIRKVEEKENAIAEVAKYAVKMSDIVSNNIDTQKLKATQILLSTLKNRRLVAMGGNISKKAKELKIDLETDITGNIDADTILYTYKNGIYAKTNL